MKDAVTDAATIVALMGKSSDSPEVAEWLRQAGAKPPKLKKGDFDAYVVLPDKGLELTFTDEAKHTMRKDSAIGEGALLLTSARFNSAAVPDFKPYPGQLPFGVALDSAQAEVQKVLENPSNRTRACAWTAGPATRSGSSPNTPRT